MDGRFEPGDFGFDDSADEAKRVAKGGEVFCYGSIRGPVKSVKEDCKLRDDPPRTRARARIWDSGATCRFFRVSLESLMSLEIVEVDQIRQIDSHYLEAWDMSIVKGLQPDAIFISMGAQM